jgi:hypothetical protein
VTRRAATLAVLRPIASQSREPRLARQPRVQPSYRAAAHPLGGVGITSESLDVLDGAVAPFDFDQPLISITQHDARCKRAVRSRWSSAFALRSVVDRDRRLFWRDRCGGCHGPRRAGSRQRQQALDFDVTLRRLSRGCDLRRGRSLGDRQRRDRPLLQVACAKRR